MLKNGDVRFYLYVAAAVLGIVAGGLAMFGLVTPERATVGMVVMGIVYTGVSGLAAKNTPRSTPEVADPSDGMYGVEGTD